MNTSISQTLRALIAAAGLGLVAHSASAHTVSLGTYNAGSPGSVTIVLGSYHTGAPNEGSISLIAGPSAPVGPIAFNQLFAVQPAQLIDGTNNFYAPNSGGAQGQYNQTVNNTLTVTRWQGATFTGLAAGVYTYQITGMNTVDYSDWNTSQPNWTGTLTISGATAGGVPDGGSAVFLMGLSILGLAALRRKL
ncbi:MAG: VPDSG-CTERM sorting domain-containing protein [Opitutaceae bacterium]|nr:VPDSG-CTERM sorting domain-containing protein [Opitutaceae bacterium]